MLRSARSLAVIALALTTLAACAGPAAAPTPSPEASASPSPTPTPTPTPPTPGEWAAEQVAAMTDEQKAASLLMLHAPGTEPGPMLALLDEGIAGVILMGDNIPADQAATAALASSLQVNPEAATLVGIDQEGGEIERLPGKQRRGDVGIYQGDDAN